MSADLVLGIADSITSGAALVRDGRIVAAVNEERLNRIKMARTEDELRDLVAPHFDVIEASTCPAFFPVLCHRSGVLQAFRATLFAVTGSRRVLEHPVLTGRRGLHLVMLARRREDRRESPT